MEITHGGVRIDCEAQPIEGAKLALHACNGCGSKAKAWQWADDAIKALSFCSESSAKQLAGILSKSNNNFPNVAEGQLFVELVEAQLATL